MSKAKRTQIEPNIFEYPNGTREIRMTAGGRTAPPLRFAAGTPIATIRAARDAQRTRMETAARGRGDDPRVAHTPSGTLEGSAPDFFEMIKGRACFKADRSHLRAWFEVVVDGARLGASSLHAITPQQIHKVIGQWQSRPSPHAIRTVRVTAYAREACTVAAYDAAGATVAAHARHGRRKKIRAYTRSGTVVAEHARPANAVGSYERSAPATSGTVASPLTIRHRCRVLDEMFAKLGIPSPLAGIKRPPRPKALVVTVPAAIVIATLQRLAGLDDKTFARFAVAATTGQRPCQIGRAQPDDLDLTSATPWWIVRDAKGEQAHPVELNDDAVAAWQAFVAADAWSFHPTAKRPNGGFDPSAYGALIHEAGWPKGIRPYNARHSLAKAMIAAGCNLGDIQAHYGHSDPKTTRIYAPFVRDRQREVSKRTAGQFGDVFKPRLVANGKRGGGK